MIWLILGVLLWTVAHWFQRLAPGVRAPMGNAGKGVVAVSLIAALALMVVGFKAADVVVLWDLGSGAVRANNALMLLAVALVGAGNSKSRLRGKIRHPMLTAALIWVVAHLLANGDLASLVLFGGIGIWAAGSMVLINRAEPDFQPWADGTARGDVKLVIITLVVFAVIAGIHSLIGPSPFGGAAG